MKLPTWFRAGFALAATLMLLGQAAPAAAAAAKPPRDRSDNTHYFDYDATSGEIGTESSSLIMTANDPVTFILFAREVEGAPEGERLAGRFSLALNKGIRRAVRYEGTFTITVKDQLGMVVSRLQVDQLITLRPRPGQRRARFSVPFDLPTGINYEAKGSFVSS